MLIRFYHEQLPASYEREDLFSEADHTHTQSHADYGKFLCVPEANVDALLQHQAVRFTARLG
jgi:hypothetical protein